MIAVPGDDAEGRAIDDRMLAVFFARDEEVRRRYFLDRGGPWHEAAFVGNWFVSLTPAEADELGRALFAIVDERRRRGPTTGARRHLSR